MQLNTIKPGPAPSTPSAVSAAASVRAWARPPVGATRARSRVPVASTRWASKAARCRLQRRLPKRGFKSAQLKYNGEITLSDLQRLAADEVDLLTLKAAGLVRDLVKHVKVIKSGELSRKVVSRASAPRLVPRPPSKPLAARSPDRLKDRRNLTRGNVRQQLAKSGKFGDLRRRIIFLVLALVVYRIGAHIPVPGIDPSQLEQLFKGQQGGILNLFNMFSGGALSRFTVFALGIMPYISASIIMQLMTYVVPTLEALKKEGEAGRRKITQYTRYGTLLLAVFQSLGIALALEGSPGLVLAPGLRLPHDGGGQPGGRHDVPDVAG
jgi:hypothetical protein